MNNKRVYYWLLAAIGFIVFLIILRIGQPANKNDDTVSPIPSSGPSLTSIPARPLPTSIPEGKNAFCERPYQNSSIWNVPIDWSVAKVHPMSDLMMAAFFENSDWIGTDTSQYTPNMYWVTNSTPLVPVQLKQNRFRDAVDDIQVQYGQPAGVVRMPLPSEARPALGTDGQLVVINVDTGEEWGLNEGYRDSEGHWFAGGVYRYSIQNSGIPPEV